MQIENYLPFVIVVSTYDVSDIVYWIPFQIRSVSPGATGVIRAHDGGRCKIKLEMIDGPRTWVLDRPDEHIYSERDVIRIGQPQRCGHPTAGPVQREVAAMGAGIG